MALGVINYNLCIVMKITFITMLVLFGKNINGLFDNNGRASFSLEKVKYIQCAGNIDLILSIVWPNFCDIPWKLISIVYSKIMFTM
jgi:hypothetical protein